MSQRLTDSDLAAIEAAIGEEKLNVTAFGDAEPEQFGGTWLLYKTPDGHTDEFYLSENRIRAIASWLDLRALLADLRAARQERDQAKEALEKARTALFPFSNFAYAYDDESFKPEYVIEDSDYGDVTVGDLRKARQVVAATEKIPCKDCPTTPVQHCCNWQVDATKEEKAE